MRVALIGATGRVGSRVLAEATSRGHLVTAIVRDAERVVPGAQATAVADVRDPEALARAVAGHDAVISAVGGAGEGHPAMVVEAASSLIAALGHADVERLLIVGGAGSLEVSPGLQLVDSPGFPEAWKAASLAQREALEVYRTAAPGDLRWTYLSPADVIEPGERTGRYLTGGDQLVRGADGRSWISMEDYAVALIDELERPAHVRARFSVAAVQA